MSNINDLNITKLKLFAKEHGITIPGISKYKAIDVEKLRKEIKKKLKSSPRKASPKKVSPKRLSPRKASPKRVSPRKASPRRASPAVIVPKAALSRASLQKLGITKLKALAKDLGISGYSKFKSADVDKLITMILKEKKASPKRVSPRKASPKRASPKKKVSPRKASPKKKASPKRVLPKRVSPKRVSPKKGYSRQQLKDMNITKLKAVAKEFGVKGYSKFRSADADKLITLILKEVKHDEEIVVKVKKAKRAVIILDESIDDLPPREAEKVEDFREEVEIVLDRKQKKKISNKDAKKQLKQSLEKLKVKSQERVIIQKAEKVVEAISDVIDLEKKDEDVVSVKEYPRQSDQLENVFQAEAKYEDEEEYIQNVIRSVKQMTGEANVDVNAAQLDEFKNVIKRCFVNM